MMMAKKMVRKMAHKLGMSNGKVTPFKDMDTEQEQGVDE